MKDKEFSLRLKVDGDISDILTQLKRLQTAFDGVEMPDSLTKSLAKDIGNAIQKVGEFGKKSEAAINSLSDSKEVASAWKSVTKILTSLQTKLDDIDPSNIFPKEVIANLEKAEAAAKRYNKALVDAKGTDTYKAKLEQLNQVAERQKIIESSEKKAKAAQLQAEEALRLKQEKWTEEVNQKYEAQQKAIQDANTALDEQTKKVAKLVEQQKKLQEEGYLNADKSVSSKRKSQVEAAKKALPEAETEEVKKKAAVSTAKAKKTRYENKNKGADLSKDKAYLELKEALIKAEKEHGEAIERTKKLREEAGKLDKVEQASNIGAEITEAKELEKSLRGEAAAAKDAASELTAQKKAIDNAKTAVADATAKHEGYAKRLEEVEQESKDINNELKNIQTDTATKEWEELVAIIKEFTGVDLTQSAHDMQAITTTLAQYKEGKVKELPKILADIVKNAKDAAPAVDRVGKEVKEVGDDAAGMAKANQEMDNLKRQVLDFFSITNTIQLFKRAVTSALNTVKELDATMTEAAVVTDFSIGDMWSKLPEYSKEAQNLGVSINGMYQATTLYYQQGLKNNAAMALGVETMKMGKIAAMDSTEATKAMTAALRGFNMELNETSATRVNDVYSQLAAVTAADTNQIATAMEKTASIAASANMEFETTAALLAQIIETTQEAPETAGTALKTIIARFAEVKSLREQGQSTGTDSEGEEIDVNKIQTALRTVGISMDGFFAGTEGLDSVLLRLSEKWGSLDFETQRYIATMAAGSRQQSRFIAMMSDYGRTTELVDEAQNSAGASQRQFEKTQESLATSLQKLENAWKQFLMGLTNNDVLKFAVDTLTTVLTVINKIIDGISGGNGLIKAVTSLVSVIGALKLGKGIFEGKGFGGLLGRLTGQAGTYKETVTETQGPDGSPMRIITREPYKEGEKAGQQAGQGFVGGFKKAVEANKVGEKGVKNFLKNTFTNGQAQDAERIDRAILEKRAAKKIKKKYTDLGPLQTRNDYLGEISNRNQNILDATQYKEIVKVYDEVYKQTGDVGQAMDAANQKTRNLGGTLLETAEQGNKLTTSAGGLTLNMNAMGQAVMGVGALFGGLSAIFSALGLEEEAEAVSKLAAVFMGLGTVMTTLSSIAPMLGMSFTTAGVQVATAGGVAQAGWGWIGLIIAAIVAIIAIVVSLVSASKSLEEELETTSKAATQLSDSAKEAGNALEKIADARAELNKLQTTMHGLVVGTNEWRQALIESNNKVLELLDTYPELAKYIATDENGAMSITTQGWETIQKTQMDKYASATQAAALLKLEETKLERRVLQKEPTDSEVERLKKDAKLKQLDLQEQAQYQAYYSSIAATDSNLAGSKYGQEAARALSAGDASVLNADIEKERERLDSYAGKLHEADEEATKQRYMEITGKTAEEVKNTDWEEITLTVAADEVNKTNVEKTAELEKAISTASESDKKTLEKLFSKESQKFTKKELDNLANTLGKDFSGLGKYLVETGIHLAPSQIAGLQDNLKNLQTAFSDKSEALGLLNDLGFKGESNVNKVIDNQSFEVFSNFVSKIQKMSQQGASYEQIESLFGEILNSTEGMSEEEQQKLLGQLATADWTYIEDIEAVISSWAREQNKTVSEFQTLRDAIVDLSGAVTSNTYAQSRDKLNQLADIQNKILNGELNNTMTGAEKEALINLGADENRFVQTGTDTYTYTGDLYSDTVMLYSKNTYAADDKAEGGEQYYSTSENVSEAVGELNSSGELKYTIDGQNVEKNGVTTVDAAIKVAELLGLGVASDGGYFDGDYYYDDLSDEEVQEDYKKMTGKTDEQIAEEGLTADQMRTALGTYDARQDMYADPDMAQDFIDYINEQMELDTMTEVKYETTEGFWDHLMAGGEVDSATLDKIYNKLLGATGEVHDTPLTGDAQRQWIEDTYKKYFLERSNTNSTYSAQAYQQGAAIAQDTGFTGQYKYIDMATDEQRDKYRAEREKGIEGKYVASGGAAYVDNVAGKTGLGKDSSVVKALATDLATVETRVKTFTTNMGKLGESLTKSNRGSVDYAKAMETAYSNIGAMFGKDTKWAKDLELDQDTIEKLVAGDPKAFNVLMEKVKEAIYSGFEEADYAGAFANLEEFKQLYSYLEITPNLQQGGLDAVEQQYLDRVNAMSAEARAAFVEDMSGLGLQLAFEYDENGNITNIITSKVDHGGSYKPKKTGGGGSKWKNSFDKFYNVYEEINKLLREREKLERRYDKLLEKRGVTAKELIENSKEELANLEEQRKNQEILVEGKKKQAEDFTKSKQGKKYAKYYTYDSETGEINIDWDAVNKLKGKKGEGFEEFIGELEGLRDQFQEAEDALFDIEDQVQEILERGKDEYLDLENQIKDALVNQRQKEIDKLSEINDSINDTNSKLLDSMQKQIDEYRQNRDNQKTEEEIADKQRRLAYLQMDTSGANATEILRLQKEIDEAQEDYTDTLIDQKISELQEQNDQAAEQRQRQIEIMEAQLKQWQDSGEIWNEVYELINAPNLEEKGLSSELLELLKSADGFEGLSKVQQMEWLKDLNSNVAQAVDWLHTGAFKSMYEEGDTVTFKNSDGNMVSGTVNKAGNIEVEDEGGNKSIYDGSKISMDSEGKLYSEETAENARKTWIDSQEPDWPEDLPKPSTVSGTIKKGSSDKAVKGVQTALTQLGYTQVGEIDGKYGPKTKAAVKAFQRKEGANKPSGHVGDWTKEKFKAYKYETGGLADFTGPAWLDGTKSKPEYVLNADQTKAFFSLVDVLGSWQSSGLKATQNNGDTSFDIDINVESIGSDYDIEQLAGKVKSMINEDARYRNNNAINLMR